MQIRLYWKKKFFSNIYNIFSNEQQVGKLRDKAFSVTSNGDLFGKEFTFKTKGIFKQHTEIIDNSENKVIGNISYNSWMTKATISINQKNTYWKYDNVWNTKWRIFNTEGIEIKYEGSYSRGQIETNTEDPLLILTGLYVTNYYWQITTAVMVAVFTPILSSAVR